MQRFFSNFTSIVLLVLSLALTAGTSPASAENAPQPNTDPYIFLLDSEALFGYADIAGPAEGDFSTSEKWLASLAVKLDEKDQLIGLYNGDYRKDNIFIRQDEGSQSSNQLMSHNLSAAYKKYFGDRFIFKPVFYFNTTFVKETADESLGDGLYDYEDLGGGFENTHFFADAEGKLNRKLTYGFNVFRREYPNYRTLEALSSREPLEDREKDFIGYKTDASYRAPWWFETTGKLSGTALFKDYTDKRTIDANGIRQSDGRKDWYYELTGMIHKQLNETFGLGFESGWKQNLSNLDFYDTRNTLTLTDDRFFTGYFDYFAYSLKPFVTVVGPKFFAEADPSTVQVSYTFEKTFYPGRTAQNVSGVLLGQDEIDRNGKTTAQFVVPMGKNWSWVLAGSYEKQVSNQKFENTFLYSYESWSVLSGVKFEL